MNKFLVFPCISQTEEEDGYEGTVVTLASSSNLTFVLFFPIDATYANMIDGVLQSEEAEKPLETHDLQMLSVYATMLDSWKASDRYLSGIVMDMVYDDTLKEEIVQASMILCDAMGNVDAVMHTSFVHAMIIGAMERKEVIITNELLEKILPEDEEAEEETRQSQFPVDKPILGIVKSIMSGTKPKSKPDKPEETGD